MKISGGDSNIDQNHLKNALDLNGFRLPNHQVRDLIEELKAKNKIDVGGKISKKLLKDVRLNFY